MKDGWGDGVRDSGGENGDGLTEYHREKENKNELILDTVRLHRPVNIGDYELVKIPVCKMVRFPSSSA